MNLLQNEKRTTFYGTFEYIALEIFCEEKYDTWYLDSCYFIIWNGYSPFSSNQYGEDEYKVIFRNILKKDYVFDDKLNISNECI